MEIKVIKGKIIRVKDEILLIPVFMDNQFEGRVKAIDRLLKGVITEIKESGEFKGKANELYGLQSKEGLKSNRVILVGLGEQKKATLDTIREAFGKAAVYIRNHGFKSFSSPVESNLMAKERVRDGIQAMVEGVMLGLYQFDLYKTDSSDDKREIEKWTLVVDDEINVIEAEKSARIGQVICEGVALARDLGNQPSNVVTPGRLAEEAIKIGRELPVKVTILEREDMEELKMGSFLGVSKGSEEPPKFIILEYSPKTKSKPIVLVGKSITFDSGGISLKPADKMEQMKGDMSGGAAVLATLKVAAQLKLQVNLVGILPATENLPSGTATKPGDVLTSLSGKTIEVINTDAEGRLILADALTYASRFKPEAIVDLATLTGAVVIALGGEAIGMLGTSEGLKERFKKSGEKTGERVWELPLWEKYFDLIKSDVADLKNTGGRSAGTITAAAFLSKFVEKNIPWVHLDIAGTAWTESDQPYIPKGNSGVGVRLLIQFLMDSLHR
ncbi:MAG: leucyl aminopeptidase [Nitrospiria bacterium]